jgi:hypothetical protein
VKWSCFRSEELVMIDRSSAGGGGESPLTSADPERIVRVITVGSW